MGQERKPAAPARVWRMSAETPQGGFVDSLSAIPVRKGRSPSTAGPTAVMLSPARVPSWRASSYDLFIGLKVRDISDTIPRHLFEELFKR